MSMRQSSQAALMHLQMHTYGCLSLLVAAGSSVRPSSIIKSGGAAAADEAQQAAMAAAAAEGALQPGCLRVQLCAPADVATRDWLRSGEEVHCQWHRVVCVVCFWQWCVEAFVGATAACRKWFVEGNGSMPYMPSTAVPAPRAQNTSTRPLLSPTPNISLCCRV